MRHVRCQLTQFAVAGGHPRRRHQTCGVACIGLSCGVTGIVGSVEREKRGPIKSRHQ